LFGTTGDEPVARDYDGDGRTDRAVVRRSNGVMTWYVLRSTNGQLQAAQFGAATDYTAPGDYDGDLKFDYAVQRPGANPTDQGTFYIMQSQTNTLASIPWGFSNDLVVPGDYDGDGKTDVAVAREGSTPGSAIGWFVRLSQSGGVLSASFGATQSDLSTQNDYDGDGKTDIAVWRDSNGTFYVRRSQDLGVTSTPWGAANDFPIAGYDTH
jgi:spore coat protein A, manganese oxidase